MSTKHLKQKTKTNGRTCNEWHEVLIGSNPKHPLQEEILKNKRTQLIHEDTNQDIKDTNQDLKDTMFFFGYQRTEL